MKEENKNIIYTGEDIKRYITGAMSPAEMHDIEMAALDDPLLAEAMEGYELMEQKDWSKELATLQQNFTKKEEAPVIPIAKAKPFKWWKAAAAVLILGTAATTAYLFTSKNNEIASNDNTRAASPSKEIAKAGTTTPGADSASMVKNESASGTFRLADSNQQLVAKADIKAIQVTSSAFTVSPAPEFSTVTSDAFKDRKDSNFIYRPDTSTSQLLAIRDDKDLGSNATEDYFAEKEYKAEAKQSPGNVTASSNGLFNSNNLNYSPGENGLKNNAVTDIVTLDKKLRESNANRLFRNQVANTRYSFSGFVLSPDNKPVSYASIKIPQNKKPIYTDANGAFTFTSADTALNVTVSSAGYNSQKFTLQNSTPQNNRIVLEPQVIATESIGKAKSEAGKRRQQVLSDSSLLEEDEEAEPSGGWIEYNNYLTNNLRLPEDAKQKNIHGEVEITVKLNNNGDISQIKVDKPLCPDCDAEAVRLVKEGPKWDVKNIKKNKVKVKIKF